MKSMKTDFLKQIKKLASLGVMIAVGAASVCSAGMFRRRVYVHVDNQTLSAATFNTETNRILDQVGVSLAPNDKVSRIDGKDGSIKLDITRAFNISIFDKNNKIDLIFTNGTVNDALKTAGIQFGENDSVNFPLDAPLEADMNITVSRFVNISITADGETKNYLAPEGTVSAAIEFLKIPLSADDVVNIDVFSDVYETMQIVINRVKTEEVTRIEEIPFKRITKKTELLASGDTKIATEGKNGKKEVVVRETKVDGKITRSEEMSCKIISEAIDEVTLIGTKGANSSQETTPPNTAGYSKILTGTATAYTAPAGARTSTGKIPKVGTVAVNPKIIPYGSKVTIKSSSGEVLYTGIAEDTGGFVNHHSKKTVADVFFLTKKECTNFGRKNVSVCVG